MNASLSTADRVTHLKIVATALAAATVVVWVGLFAHRNGAASHDGSAQLYRSVPSSDAVMAAETGRAIR
jgi:hypothetical protein